MHQHKRPLETMGLIVPPEIRSIFTFQKGDHPHPDITSYMRRDFGDIARRAGFPHTGFAENFMPVETGRLEGQWSGTELFDQASKTFQGIMEVVRAEDMFIGRDASLQLDHGSGNDIRILEQDSFQPKSVTLYLPQGEIRRQVFNAMNDQMGFVESPNFSSVKKLSPENVHKAQELIHALRVAIAGAMDKASGLGNPGQIGYDPNAPRIVRTRNGFVQAFLA